MKTTTTQQTDDAMAAMAAVFPTAMTYALSKPGQPVKDIAAVYFGQCPESMAREGHFWIVQGRAFHRCTNRTGCRTEQRAKRCGQLLAARWGFIAIFPEVAR